MPTGLYLEKTALLDRIRFYESNARYSGGDRFAKVFDPTEEHMAFAQARLKQIDAMIAGFETVYINALDLAAS
jgi:hypothetical protein